ncbi:MAG TPA: hypothetical protein PKE57_09730 [Cellvibrionaceae bacterium]|nr:hypothetical protein [Cellvibrionaceae bacterium]HMW48549.1 hypothetical protein [Cellvibrionaceae bacterium]
MRLTAWQRFFFALVLLIFVGQAAAASIAICPKQAHNPAEHETPPCHQTHVAVKTNAHGHHPLPDCCQQLGHCLLQGAAALIGTELTFTVVISTAAPNYGYHRTPPHPQNYSLFRPPIA